LTRLRFGIVSHRSRWIYGAIFYHLDHQADDVEEYLKAQADVDATLDKV
jgi:hypothetical protein